MKSKATYCWVVCGWLAASSLAVGQSSDEPPIAQGAVILGPKLSPAPAQPLNAPLVLAPGRFVAISPADGSPSYIAPSASYQVQRIPPGGFVFGIKYDEPANADAKIYSWPDVKGPVYAILAKNVPGLFSIQLLKNGDATTGPIENGAPLTMQVGQLPIPPPVPPPIPPTPIPATGFRVLFVYETSANNTREQMNIIYSTVIAEYLNRKAVKGSDGLPEWRRWDPNIDGKPPGLTKQTATLQALWAATKPKLGRLPAIVIVNDAKGEVLPLPETEAATLELLRRYGGD